VARKPLRERLAQRFKNFGRTQYTCSCGKHFSNRMMWNGHRCMDTFRGASKKAREAARNKGRQMSEAWKHARRTRLADGLIDQRGQRTAKGRSRPNGPVRGRKDLQARHRHGRDHDRADRHDQRAKRHETRGKHALAERSRQRARDLRSRHPERPARPAPAPPERKPEPARTRPPAPGPARPRWAPRPSRNRNGTRPAPQRTGRTRT